MTDKQRDQPIVMAIGMGHRNLDKGGASGEFEWTPGAARALQRRAQARGMIADLLQELDGDDDPNFSHLDRMTAAARGVNAVIKLRGRCDVVIFMHYNGGSAAGAHFLHPDGWDRGLSKSDNMGDVRMCRAIARHVGETGTVSLLTPKWANISDEPGVMSERQSGAVKNIKGWRLGEMLGPEEHRANLFRVITEAGSIDVAREAAHIRDPRWVEFTYCEAILNGVEDELGVFRPDGVIIDTTPGPDPHPVDPGVDVPVKLPEIDALNGLPDAQMPATVQTEKEGWMFFIGRDVTVTNPNGTPRHQLPQEDHPGRTGADLQPGERFYAWFGGTSASGRPYAYTLWATRVWLDDTDFGTGLEAAVRQG